MVDFWIESLLVSVALVLKLLSIQPKNSKRKRIQTICKTSIETPPGMKQLSPQYSRRLNKQ